MKSNDLKFKIASGLLLIMIGLSFMLSDFVSDKREKVFNSMNIELNELLAAENVNNELEEDNHEEEDEPSPSEEEEPALENEQQENQYEAFAGVLEIPKIGFSKGFYKKGSSLNNVKFNLKILDVSSYPGEEKGNVIIIGHSGNYNNSYFGNLYKLDINDTANIQYNGRNYFYKIVNIYQDKKDGTVTIYRDVTKNCLTLITCTKDDDTTQTIYILEQYSVE